MSAVPAPRESHTRAKSLGRPRLCVARIEGRSVASRVLRRAREACGLSRTQLGRRLGVSESMIYQWESEDSRDAIALGDVVAASPAFLAEITRLLGEEAQRAPAAGVSPVQHLTLVMRELGDVARVVAASGEQVPEELDRELAQVAAAIDAMRRDVRALSAAR